MIDVTVEEGRENELFFLDFIVVLMWWAIFLH